MHLGHAKTVTDLLYSKTIAYVLIYVTTSDVYLFLSSPALPAIVHAEIMLNIVSVHAVPHCESSGEQSIGWSSIEQGTA